MTSTIPYLGEILALSTAIVWSLAVVLFKKSGEIVHPIALNVFKSVLGAALLWITLLIMGISLLQPLPPRDYLLLVLSGVLGIGIADTLFFMSLNLLGAGLSAVVDCLYAPSLISLSMIFLGERLSPWQIVGAAVIISAVLVVAVSKRIGHITRPKLLLGTLWAFAAMMLMAAGVVIAKPILERTPLLWVTEWRLLGGVAILLLHLLILPNRRDILGTLFTAHGWHYTIAGSFLGAYVSMILWLGGMKFTQASVAAALNQMSNVFIFIFAFVFLREPISRLKIAAIVLAVGGAYLVMFG